MLSFHLILSTLWSGEFVSSLGGLRDVIELAQSHGSPEWRWRAFEHRESNSRRSISVIQRLQTKAHRPDPAHRLFLYGSQAENGFSIFKWKYDPELLLSDAGWKLAFSADLIMNSTWIHSSWIQHEIIRYKRAYVQNFYSQVISMTPNAVWNKVG